MEKILREGLLELGVEPSNEALAAFHVYCELLKEKNKVINLTAISGEEDIARLHFLDCAAVLTAADFSGASVIDIGSGAGFPGLPLRILKPGIRLTLLDSLGKRVDFLKEVCAALKLEDVVCLNTRAEEAPECFRGNFDFAVSRAVARVNVLCELCMPFVRVGGMFLAMKGPDCMDEINEAKKAIEVLGGSLEETRFYKIPGTDIKHSLVRIRKISSTPEKYPRRFAKIQKRPL